MRQFLSSSTLRTISTMRRASGLAAMLLLLGSAVPAQADIITFSNDPAGFQAFLNAQGIIDRNILFEQAGTINGPAPTVTGALQNGFQLSFTSDENLVTKGSGAARIEAATGSFDNLFIDAVDPTALFRSISFNLNPTKPGGRPVTGEVTFVVTDQFGPNAEEVFSFNTSGLFFFGAVSVNGQFIDTVDFASSLPLDDIRQVKVGGEQSNFEVSVPEPATTVLFGMGLIGLARRFRRR